MLLNTDLYTVDLFVIRQLLYENIPVPLPLLLLRELSCCFQRETHVKLVLIPCFLVVNYHHSLMDHLLNNPSVVAETSH